MAKIDIKATVVFERLSDAYNSKKYKGFVLPGGTRSSKTHSIIQFMLMYCQYNYKKNKKILIARQAYSDLKDTVMRDFFDILKSYRLYKEKDHTRSNPQSYEYMGNTIYFRGLDAGGSHGEAYDVVWINEAFESELDAFRQLNQRLREFFIMDYNPNRWDVLVIRL
jgi:phage terminase large subunit